MANAKIEFTIGNISFSGEGEEQWLSTQLDKVIAKAPDLFKIVPLPPIIPPETEIKQQPMKQDTTIASQTLPNFLKEKNATKSQVLKFLATAVWLEAKGNKTRLTTADITKALKDSNQSRIGNPSDMLAKNVAKGFCERDGKEFFITDDGKASL